MNDKRMTRRNRRGEIVAKLGRDVLRFLRVRKFSGAVHGKLQVKDGLCHASVGLNRQPLTCLIGRVQQAIESNFRKPLQIRCMLRV